ncbi:MAG: LTA synthase family protein [Bacillota bacterium]|nr:LTA synthase family protein [Bacillota bacterium]
MNLWQSLLAILLSSGLISALQLVIQQGDFLTSLNMYFRNPVLFLLNGLPVVAVMTLLWLILRNVFYSASISTLLFGLLSYVNLLKVVDREDPLIPSDIPLFREALDSAVNFSLDLYWSKLILILVVTLLFLVLGLKIKSKHYAWKMSLLCFILVSITFAGLVHFVYGNKSIYQSFRVPNKYNIASVFNTLGFNYCFLYHLNLYHVEKPEGYSESEIQALEYEPGEGMGSEPKFKPHVLMVMCEAYSDISEEDSILYGDDDSPMKEYREAISKNAVDGYIVVPNYGAGTANTEFDVLTGMQTNLIGNTSSFRLVRKKTANLTSLFRRLGYHTMFLHPGQSWFYNRNSVYQHLGMQDQIYNDAFDASDFKGTMISDAAFLEKLIALFEEKKKDGPVFAYTVTIQNHQAYHYGKFGIETPPVPTKTPVSEASAESLSVYMEGVRDSSKMLLDLCRYIDTVDEPMVIVFFGDHRPNLLNAPSELGLGYNDFTDSRNAIATFQVPLMIRVNDAYVRQKPVDFESLDLPEDFVLSANYVGSVLLELLQFQGIDAYFDELMKLRRELPVIKHLQDAYMLGNQEIVQSLPEHLQKRFDLIHRWMYYRLKHSIN